MPLFSLLLQFSFEASELLYPLHTCCEACELKCLFSRTLYLCVDLDRIALLGYCANSSTVVHMSNHIRSLQGCGKGQCNYCFERIHIHIPWDPPCDSKGYLLLVCSSRFRPFSCHRMSKHIYSQQLVSVNGRRDKNGF